LHNPEKKPYDGATVHLFNLIRNLGARAPVKVYRSILSLLRDRGELEGAVVYTRDITKVWRLLPFKPLLPPLILEVNGLPSYELEINRKTQGCRFPILTPALKLLWMIKEWVAFRMADRILAVTKGLANSIVSDYGCGASKVRVVPNAVDIAQFRPMRRKRGRPRSILFASAFLPHRATLKILDIARDVLDKYPLASFTIVGDGPELPLVKERARAYGISQALTFLPTLPHEQMPSVIGRADICLYDYLRNDWAYYEKIGICPLKVLEYMASGKGIVALRFPGLLDELEKFGAALLVDHVKDVPDKILAMLQYPRNLKAYGRRARSLAEDRYSWERVIGQIIESSRDLLKQMERL